MVTSPHPTSPLPPEKLSELFGDHRSLITQWSEDLFRLVHEDSECSILPHSGEWTRRILGLYGRLLRLKPDVRAAHRDVPGVLMDARDLLRRENLVLTFTAEALSTDWWMQKAFSFLVDVNTNCEVPGAPTNVRARDLLDDLDLRFTAHAIAFPGGIGSDFIETAVELRIAEGFVRTNADDFRGPVVGGWVKAVRSVSLLPGTYEDEYLEESIRWMEVFHPSK